MKASTWNSTYVFLLPSITTQSQNPPIPLELSPEDGVGRLACICGLSLAVLLSFCFHCPHGPVLDNVAIFVFSLPPSLQPPGALGPSRTYLRPIHRLLLNSQFVFVFFLLKNSLKMEIKHKLVPSSPQSQST